MQNSLYLLFAVLACWTTPILAQRNNRQGQSQYCVTPDNYYGSCVTLSYCPQVVNIFSEVDQQYAQQYLFSLQRACGTRNIRGDPVVCCTRPQNRPPTTSSPMTSNPFLNQNTRRPLTTVPPFVAPEPLTTTTTASSVVDTAALIDNKASYCRGPDTKEGTCTALETCQALLSRLQANPKDETFRTFLRSSNQICGSVGSRVCCPNANTAAGREPDVVQQPTTNTGVPRRFPTIAEGCGVTTNSYRKIVGGKVSKKGAWPWAALLGYDDGVSTAFRCGGTLVTARHVVTAAHCIVRGLSVIRVGEHDLSTDTETQHVDVPVSKTVIHPRYNRSIGHSDIAVVYLQRNVEFTKLIAPICMPQTQEQLSKSYVSYMPFVVGWGKTMEGGYSSDVLQELQIPVYENNVCASSYAKVKRYFAANQFDSAVLCAGVLSGGKDTCQGDSGGPLMFPEPYQNNVRFLLIGVVSYGVGCARPEIPGVYSSVQYHMDWLKQQIANTP